MPSTGSFSRPLVVFGPSGTGKSTLLKKLFADHPDKFGFSVSHTTRSPRAGETNGKEYHFTTREQFLSLVDQGAFIEHAQFSGNLYGTTVKAVQDVAERGRRCILDIDAQGVRTIKEKHPNLNPVFVFISPPSLDALRSRLVGRGTETNEALNARLSAALDEIFYARTGRVQVVDHVVVNDVVERAYSLLEKLALGVGEGVKSDELPPF
ncbi:P-loop containing nucleoside triphosphate hydrolase protein [Cantharellus anzutake]|uniref:P-loop containing nucleoside triphosphate hydrolase protein n=1 Tax=Cantharellus anzutake TaxID=1750568 RepID=UPI001908F08D|nr:P-loop containing nucleoside triphosphate hydrolase protein [Cantharellus anzutake]KAF8331071.1 P-loop containing nucleoside triphosphate hydrolase protein [Cantharellus anzutake]